jgi:hypothetical protein
LHVSDLPFVRPALLILLLLSGSIAATADAPFPSGVSDQEHDGMAFSLVMPSRCDAAKDYPLLIILHGRGGRASSLASGFSILAREDIVVCAPQSANPSGWDQPNVDRAKGVLDHLVKTLSIDKKRLHGLALSQACPSLSSIVFDKKYHFITASWGMGGCSGGKVPKWARKEMGVFVMVGSEDWAYGAAVGSVKMLQKKVRSVECHVQKGIGHEYPIKVEPLYRRWLTVMNGRFVPGDCGFLDWTEDVEAAKKDMAAKKTGALLYVYSADDADDAEARRVQNEVLLDPMVRHFGERVVALKLERKRHPDLIAALKLKGTPAVVALKPDFSVAKAFEGKKVKASALAKALRGVAKDRSMPKQPGVFVHE